MRLNEAQQKLVSASFDVPVVGVAGAGTGKTTTIIERAKRALNNVSGDIYLVTFTRNSANDLKKRLNDERVKASTFHSLMGQLLRSNAKILGLSDTFTILDENGSHTALSRNLSSLFPDELAFLNKRFNNLDRKTTNFLSHLVSKMINTASFTELETGKLTPDTRKRLFSSSTFYFDSSESESFTTFLSIIYHLFVLNLTVALKDNTINFDQVLFLTNMLLNAKDNDGKPIDALKSFKKNLGYLIVDEYQDTNKLQDEFIDAITNNNLTVVGDIDQAIYEFRGGTPDLLVNRAAKSIVVNLTTNYRSYQPILDCANNVIKHNKTGKNIRRDLVSFKHLDEHFDGVDLTYAFDEKDEGTNVINKIKFYQKKGIPLNHQIVLVRSRKALNTFVSLLKTTNMTVNNRTRFADITRSNEMIDLTNYLKIIVNPNDEYAFLGIINRPKRSIGEKNLAYLIDKAQTFNQNLNQFIFSDNLETVKDDKKKKLYQSLLDFKKMYQNLTNLKPENTNKNFLSKLIDTIISKTKYDDWIAGFKKDAAMASKNNLLSIKMLADKFEDDFKQTHNNYTTVDLVLAFLNDVAERKNALSPDGLVVSTVHDAKGLEYDEVFLLGINDGYFPSNLSDIESERRLFYVALTRAKNGLHLYSTAKRLGQSVEPSCFISELGNDINTIQTLKFIQN